MPVTGNLMVDKQKVMELVDQLRLGIPQEVKAAEEVLTQKDQIISQAIMDAKRAKSRAEDEFHRIVSAPGVEPEIQLFDLAEDPGATRNLYDDANDRQLAMAKLLGEYKDRLTRDAARDERQRPTLGEEEDIKMRLRALGYIGYTPLD